MHFVIHFVWFFSRMNRWLITSPVSHLQSDGGDDSTLEYTPLFRRLRTLRPDLPDETLSEMYANVFWSEWLTFDILQTIELCVRAHDSCTKLQDPQARALLPYNISQWLFNSLLDTNADLMLVRQGCLLSILDLQCSYCHRFGCPKPERERRRIL